MSSATARSVRSRVAPAGRDDDTRAASSRPRLQVVAGGKDKKKNESVASGFFSRIRTVSVVHVIIAVVFLFAALLGSLALRTQMVQNSFEQAQVQSNISKLNQDVEDDQAQLDSLQASLPDRAQKMGMVPQSGPLSIDLQGYQPTDKGQ
ncbi:hypothetical protein OZX67_06915 [Bifidobacterium sp. ESL0728]|uniref:hypothetical protein n=1 Tax=Bifidobacterium sp. ESL0728 TaxID=2983220 RepID=UPI0023F8541A|nr:hypothetical protein [Bifidobacterium sp. ESL0728]WEV59991.1 hypothetical protein OZX67_06915 [Bifidobacterium sp. ESL0728]